MENEKIKLVCPNCGGGQFREIITNLCFVEKCTEKDPPESFAIDEEDHEYQCHQCDDFFTLSELIDRKRVEVQECAKCGAVGRSILESEHPTTCRFYCPECEDGAGYTDDEIEEAGEELGERIREREEAKAQRREGS